MIEGGVQLQVSALSTFPAKVLLPGGNGQAWQGPDKVSIRTISSVCRPRRIA